MSRSFKKTPIVKSDKYSFSIRHWLNKRIRNIDIGNNSLYKKLNIKYGIYDDRHKCDLYKRHGYNKYEQRPMTIEEINEYWRK